MPQLVQPNVRSAIVGRAQYKAQTVFEAHPSGLPIQQVFFGLFDISAKAIYAGNSLGGGQGRMHTLDHIDARIIELLNEDGRMPSAEIARRLGGISPRTVNYRVDGLIERGLITIRAVVNPRLFGYEVLADVLIETEPGQLRAVAMRVAQLEQVTYVAGATGDR